MNWKDLCIGYGIEKLPANLRGQFQCAFPCSEKNHLYTTKSIKPKDHTTHAYDLIMRGLIGHCYCKTHMKYLYGDEKS